MPLRVYVLQLQLQTCDEKRDCQEAPIAHAYHVYIKKSDFDISLLGCRRSCFMLQSTNPSFFFQPPRNLYFLSWSLQSMIALWKTVNNAMRLSDLICAGFLLVTNLLIASKCATVTDDHVYYILMEHNTSYPNYFEGAVLTVRKRKMTFLCRVDKMSVWNFSDTLSLVGFHNDSFPEHRPPCLHVLFRRGAFPPDQQEHRRLHPRPALPILILRPRHWQRLCHHGGVLVTGDQGARKHGQGWSSDNIVLKANWIIFISQIRFNTLLR